MSLADLINSIKIGHQEYGIRINPPATLEEFQKAEIKLGFQLPADFREFFSICNGFERKDDNFAIISLDKLFLDSDFGKDCVIFAQYMTYSDVWILRKLQGESYEIFSSEDEYTVLTTSLTGFLQKVLQAHVSEEGGLFKWPDEIKKQ